ncbi:stress response protein YsnF/sporulation protein YlmC with PRC-barrel domain [Kitasatospora sp. GP82]|nr:stress response protein YsnF/sporulation protein YlmC with PRC-barrel domain [Kitasatospora sp. GP82]
MEDSVQTDIDPRDLIGHKAVDRNGDKIGTVDEVYLDDATGEPEWAAVRTGIFGRDAFVPLTTSEFSGEELRVPYDKSLIKDSPDFGVGQHLSPAQELQLYRYYGLDADGAPPPPATNGASKPADLDFGTVPAAPPRTQTAPAPTPATEDRPVAAPIAEHRPIATPAPEHRPAAAESTAEHRPTAFTAPPAPPASPLTEAAKSPTTLDKPAPRATEANRRAVNTPAVERTPAAAAPSSAPSGPIEITCREERLDISTEWHVLGTARLRKYVTTEPVERRVPVVRERVRVERIPVTEAERAVLSDREIAEAVEEVTLRGERPVVRKTPVPIERVRLVVERYTEEEVIREELRREHVEVQDSTGADIPAAPTAPPSAPPPARPEPLRHA